MTRPLQALRGLPVLARDGQAGALADLYLDERLWLVRTLVVEGTSRHASRLLVPAASARIFEPEIAAIAVGLSLHEIAALGRGSDLSLRSARSLAGYAIEAQDAASMGRCEDVFVDDESWSITGFVAHSPRLFGGGRYLVPARAVAAIDAVSRTLRLRLTRQQVARLAASARLEVLE